MNSTNESARERWKSSEFTGKMRASIEALAAKRLDGGDLRGITIGPGGPVEALSNITLHRAKISNADMSQASLACSLSESALEHVLFAEAHFDDCLFKKARVVKCGFARARLVVRLDDSIFEQCDFSEAAFTGRKALIERGGRRVNFIGCNFAGTEFRGVEFRASRFTDCTFAGARFSRSDFRGVKVDGGSLPSKFQFEGMEPPAWAT
jgi:uncharacterized protein YjbI with pentapeptide repeats